MMKIICFGNMFMTDDSIGIIIGQLLKKKSKNFNVIICETDINYSNQIVTDNEPILIIDAIDISRYPGDYILCKMPPVNNFCLTSHDMRFYNSLNMTYIFGVQIKTSNFGIGISKEIQIHLKEYISLIINFMSNLIQ